MIKNRNQAEGGENKKARNNWQTIAFGGEYRQQGEDMQGDADEPYTADTRAEAAAIMAGVGAFFRTVEPSSPIPMVLGRAERFMNLSFQAIIADLVPKREA